MSDFLLELRSEEIPARMQDKAREYLAAFFEERMRAANLEWSGVEVYSTPRRLVIIVRGVAVETIPSIEERKGPRADAPVSAIEGFLRSTGLRRDQLVTREDKKGTPILFGVIKVPGLPASDILKSATIQAIRAFPWPKSMRWGAASASTESLRWVRPLQGIVAILGEDVIDLEVAGVRSGAATVGHRFHHPGVITIGGASDYVEKLRACHVVVDQEERRTLIRERATALAADAGLTLVEDEGLVSENAGLTEWPVPLLGRFDADFLDVPPEVIQLTARVNQKYFVCRDGAGALANAFVCVANIDAADGGAKIVEGNRKVLAARLSDARFFYETDLKVPLEEQARKLEKIVFHEKLGTVADKVERVAKLARWLVEEGIVEGLADMAERAARLAKADLVTGMVGEFPELQGLMGGYYAAAQGEPAEIAEAIRDHYKPVGQGDAPPSATLSQALSLADKLDSILSFFSIDEKPTGSKDPFALRRSMLGVLATLVDNQLRLSLRRLPVDQLGNASSSGELHDELIGFATERLKVQQREAGVRHDLIDAVFALGGEDDLVRLLARVHALQAFVGTEDGANLLTGYRRAANILKKEGWEASEAKPLPYAPEPAEADLIAALDSAAPRAAAAVEAEDFEAAMAALASLRTPIDAFFDQVTVNDSDPAKREARLALLARMRDAMHQVADFSKIEG